MTASRKAEWQLWRGGRGFVNITTNEMGLAPDEYDEAHQLYRQAVPFSAATWNIKPWDRWADANRETWLPFYERFLLEVLPTMLRVPLADDENHAEPKLYRRVYAPDTIRVFEMMPSSGQSGIHGQLHEVNLSFVWPSVRVYTDAMPDRKLSRVTNFGVSLSSREPICYTALSYCWGPPDFDSSISINGVQKRITNTLYEALAHLQHPHHSVLLWIDQICIDQDDDIDMTAQLKLMDKVYKRAWNTIIWIGPDTYDGAFKALEGMHEVLRYQHRGRLLPQELEELLRPPAGEDERALQNLRSLLRQPWFTRTWIIQEACLSQEPFLMAGHSTIAWQDFSSWCRTLAEVMIIDPDASSSSDTARDVETIHIDGLTAAAQLDQLRDRIAVAQKDELFPMLVVTRYALVTKQIDKVYGVLGMSGLDHGEVTIDSALRPAVLYSEVAAKIAQGAIDKKYLKRDCYLLMCCVDHEPSPDLASWAVDWSKPRVTTSLGYDVFHAAICRAGGEMNASFDARLDLSSMTLHLPGVRFDTVQRLTNVFRIAELSADDCATSNGSLREAVGFVNLRTPNKPGDGFLTFCQTVVAGRDGVDKVAYPTEFTEILSLLCDATMGTRPAIVGQTYTTRQQRGYFTTANLKSRSAGRTFQSLKKAYKAAMLNRRLCWSAEGRLGLVPRHTQPGDMLCAFPGSVVPFVLQGRDDGSHMLVGECYVHDVMQGQLFCNGDSPSTADIRLV